jgi:hypothetical protein
VIAPINKMAAALFIVYFFASVHLAEAQQPKKIARVGYLSPQSGPGTSLVVFKEGLRELGWAEGKQIEFDYRYAGDSRPTISSVVP